MEGAGVVGASFTLAALRVTCLLVCFLWLREEAPCWVSVEQSPFVLGLTSENSELLLDECVQVTEGSKIKQRHLFLFTDVLVLAKLNYRLKHRVDLADVWLCGFEEEHEEDGDDSGTIGDIDTRLTLVLAWDLTFCLVCFRKASNTNKSTKSHLFGQPLCNICPDDNSLPKPITCFLKELPGSLLRSDLYNRWTAALDHEDTEQRALEIKKVIYDLPGPNKLLLQYLICVFHCILESSDINKMDASNLAVCIGPTLLQLDDTPLDGQREKMGKVETLEINVPFHYSLSSVHHDSAYDSPDPDGDGEAGEKRRSTDGGRGSSSSYSSLSPSITTSSWQSDAAFDNKAPFNRRCSEPILLLPENLENLRSHARSHDDCSMQRDEFDEQPLKKQISDDSFLLKGRGGASSVLSFPKLSCSSNMDLLPYMGKDWSCSSLESTASNQSESSVFTNSPVGSPKSSKKNNSNSQPIVITNGKLDVPRPISEEKRRSQSMRVASKVLMRTRSLGAFSRSSLKKDSQKENSFPETLQEDSQSEADPLTDVLLKSRPLSAIEVFKQVDSKLPCRPPSYEQAVQNMAPPPQYGSMTVQDALTLERRSRPSSVNYDFPIREYVYNQDCFSQMAQDNVVKRQQPFRQRAMSESITAGQHEVVSHRCSQPVFEEFSYAKESYV
ncbi:hypothetical protein GOODEAATRI_007414 [Goodea atripinnis]|uniref:Rho-GAP domain-containing protein n=1 Tax=Goodea atripinnis TaxID=208336 RepID=A0ABV0PC61_9TELE